MQPVFSRTAKVPTASDAQQIARPVNKDIQGTVQDKVAATSDRFLRRFIDLWLLCAVVIWLFVAFPGFVFSFAIQFPSYIMLVVGLSVRFAVHSGHSKLAGYLFVLPLCACAMLLPLFASGVRTPLIASVPLLLLLAGWMLGRRVMAILTVLFVLDVILFWFAESQGWLILSPLRTPEVWSRVWVFVIVITGIVVWSLIGNYEADRLQETELQRRLSDALNLAESSNRELISVLKFNETVLLHSPLPIGVYAADGQCVEANQAFAELVGGTREGLLAQNFRNIASWQPSGLLDDCLKALENNVPRRRETKITTTFGRDIIVECRILPTELNGEKHLLVQLFDLGERKKIEVRLRDALAEAQRLRDALETVSAYVFTKDRTGRYTYANKKVCDFFGYPLEEIVGATDEKFFDLAITDDLRKNDRRVLDRGDRVESEEVTAIAGTGEKRIYWTVKSPIVDEMGTIVGMCGISTDITQIKRTEEDLTRARLDVETANRELKAVLKVNETILMNSPLPIGVYAADGQCIEANEAYAQLVGASRMDLLAQNFHDIREWQVSGLLAKCLIALTNEKAQRREIKATTSFGKDVCAECRILPTRLNGENHVLIQFIDLTERKRIEEELRHYAFHDVLTHLPNRRLLLDRVEHAMQASKRQDSYLALLFLDLNNFKQINDTHGHDTGDQLLVEVAQRMRKTVREIDTVARLGGDEFVVLLEGLGPDALVATEYARSVANKIRWALSEEYVLGAVRHHCSVSIGIKLFFGDTDGDPDEILKEADKEMYVAKKRAAA